MKLSQKIKHIKRHKNNKRIAKYADDVHFAAAECFLTGDKNVFVISQRLYFIMKSRGHYIPKNIKSSGLNRDDEIITVPRDITEFYNDNKLDYIKEWCGIPITSSEPLYCHIDKSIAPDITTLNGVRV